MSRTGWSASNLLRKGGSVVTATVPFTVAGWGRTSITNQFQTMFGVFTPAGIASRNSFRLMTDTSAHLIASTGDGSSNSDATTSTTFAANTWFHACGVWAAANDRRVFLNGGGKGTQTTSRTPSGLSRASIGAGDSSSVIDTWAPSGTGMIAEVAKWSIALTDAEVALIAAGMSPLKMHPEALTDYWPIYGDSQPEINLISNDRTMSVVGTLTQSTVRPRIIMPKRRKLAA